MYYTTENVPIIMYFVWYHIKLQPWPLTWWPDRIRSYIPTSIEWNKWYWDAKLVILLKLHNPTLHDIHDIMSKYGLRTRDGFYKWAWKGTVRYIQQFNTSFLYCVYVDIKLSLKSWLVYTVLIYNLDLLRNLVYIRSRNTLTLIFTIFLCNAIYNEWILECLHTLINNSWVEHWRIISLLDNFILTFYIYYWALSLLYYTITCKVLGAFKLVRFAR